jgi:hypothetical protein
VLASSHGTSQNERHQVCRGTAIGSYLWWCYSTVPVISCEFERPSFAEKCRFPAWHGMVNVVEIAPDAFEFVFKEEVGISASSATRMLTLLLGRNPLPVTTKT